MMFFIKINLVPIDGDFFSCNMDLILLEYLKYIFLKKSITIFMIYRWWTVSSTSHSYLSGLTGCCDTFLFYSRKGLTIIKNL